MVCANLSAWPLDCAFIGGVILYSVCHSQVKSLNSYNVNCVSPSEIIHLGTPITVKISFRILITLIKWRLCSFLTMKLKNQLLEDSVCLSMKKCLKQVVPIQLNVFLLPAVSPFVEILQTLHKCDTDGRCP